MSNARVFLTLFLCLTSCAIAQVQPELTPPTIPGIWPGYAPTSPQRQEQQEPTPPSLREILGPQVNAQPQVQQPASTALVIHVVDQSVWSRLPSAVQTQLAQLCDGPPVWNGPGFAAVEHAAARLDWAFRSLFPTITSVTVYVSALNIPNAGTYAPPGRADAVVCVYSGLPTLLGNNEDEIAGILAHELGHVGDHNQPQCHGTQPLAQIRSCEKSADSWGFELMWKAGYDIYAMAGAFGRLEMYSGDIKTNLFERIKNTLNGDHPITPDRIESLREIAIWWCAHYQCR